MKKIKRTLFVLLSVGSVLSSTAQVTPFVAGRLQYTLDSVCTKYKLRGASVAVLIPNVGVWKGVYGTSEAGVPLTSDMLMGMGSNTKTHIAATLLKMQEQQLLSLDDTIGQWIQGYPNISGQITIRQCLNHTSGLFDYMQNESINDSIFGSSQKEWTPEEILHMAKAPNFAPGSSWDYSNTNYIISGIIISKVMQKPAYQVVNELILQPSQLQHTFDFKDKGTIPFAHPWSMSLGDEAVDMTTTPYLNTLFSLANTAGSMLTTAEDNVQFWYKLWSKQIINEQSWKEMTTLKSLGNKDGYGLGIFMYSRKMNGRTFYSHGGTFFGYINENMVDTTSGVTIAVLTNQDSMSNDGLLSLVIKALHKVTLNMPATGLLEDEQLIKNVAVYPNPSSIFLKVELLTDNFSGNLELTDITGKQVYSQAMNGPTSEVDTRDIPVGLYLLQLKQPDGITVYNQRVQIVR